ncbi:tRNA (adenosine(37)-N6)-dimethylallyltransferase MiaA [Baekduia soli]|uniref:tRNA (adenosine(37)-N6)-dimethylallyltransferase MiaA n=1 Tax=Baekduia soli TaxID=496014 RepID=UPI001E2F2392|nr:tRNA (adenosine(37)-N6)-dimethylallyltransferase MiaA [Baekduia soli]
MPVLALFGPTGIGKTALALEVADRLRARGERPVAVSADALQVYRGLETLTGVASPAEQERLEHRLVAFVDVRETFSVARYAALAHAEIDALLDAGATPIVVGGTGLYLRAALAELELRPPPAPGVRERLMADAAARGTEVLHAELAARAPAAAAGIDPRDRHRVVRALELEAQGALASPPEDNRLWTADTRRPTRLVALTMQRAELHARIDARVEAMVAAGAAREVAAADAAGASPTARKALGFDELLAGDVEAMKTRTRRYARRQLTWLRKLPGVEHVDLTGRRAADVAAELVG